MLSDGDSVAYKAVVDANFYPVEKMECVNPLRQENGDSIAEEIEGGKAWWVSPRCSDCQRLHHTAVLLSKCYHEQPCQCREDEAGHLGIFSALHVARPETPAPAQCPDGPSSWCFFNKAIANGQQPPPHKEHVGTPMSADVAKAVKPIYDRMSDLSLLGSQAQSHSECKRVLERPDLGALSQNCTRRRQQNKCSGGISSLSF